MMLSINESRVVRYRMMGLWDFPPSEFGGQGWRSECWLLCNISVKQSNSPKRIDGVKSDSSDEISQASTWDNWLSLLCFYENAIVAQR